MSWYVERERFELCSHGDRVASCYHVPRCVHQRPGKAGRGSPFGRTRTGWTGPIRSEQQAGREAEAWRGAGWTARVVEANAEVRAAVRAWQRDARRAAS